MRVVTFTNLYPSAARPRHGIFIEHRIRQLAATGEATVRVVAPTPWAPKPARRLLGQYAALAEVPEVEIRHGISVWHPRFLAVPKLTSWINPLLMALSALPLMKRLQREQDFDLIDAHFVYPDGAAAVLLASWLGKPVSVTARGTDINEFPRYRVPRAWINWVIRRADGMITVSDALRSVLLSLGAEPERVTVLRNGVDLGLFAPRDPTSVRTSRAATLISVGHLIPDKGHHFVIEALQELPDVRLVIVGDGPMRGDLQALAARLGVADRIEWTGTLSQDRLAIQYAAADATVLASKLEGMPNVLLESIACGTPVIATNVGGNAEIVSSRSVGRLMRDRSAGAIVEAYRDLESDWPDREAVRRCAEQFGWGPTVQGMLEVLGRLIASRGRAHQAKRASAAGLG